MFKEILNVHTARDLFSVYLVQLNKTCGVRYLAHTHIGSDCFLINFGFSFKDAVLITRYGNRVTKAAP